MSLVSLQAELQKAFGGIAAMQLAYGQLTLTVSPEHLLTLAASLRTLPQFDFAVLIDLCGVDYLHYGYTEWETQGASAKGFERGVHALSRQVQTAENAEQDPTQNTEQPRFAVVVQLLSITHNQRLSLKTWAPNDTLMVPSLTQIWASANWYEREAFDLYGILFQNHPDLRRILLDYGFIGHPFRKDFPLVGNVEVRYDAAQKRVIYEPVSITPRTLVPKVIRADDTGISHD